MQAMKHVCTSEATYTPYWSEELLKHGYCIIPQATPRETIAGLHRDLQSRFDKTPFGVGDFYGSRTKRFGGVLKRSEHARSLIMDETILGIAQDILGPHCDRIQLNLTQAVEIHPGQPAQHPHRDQDMWRGPAGAAEYLINVMWPFTDYTEENGATTVWPGSHLRMDEEAIDPSEAITAEMQLGDALVFLGSTLHGAGANISKNIRAGMIVSYCLGWLKPYENQWLVYPPEVAKGFDPELAAMVGYRQHRPNLGNYEGQCPSVLLAGDVPEYMGAVDELRPDQLAMLAEMKAGRG